MKNLKTLEGGITPEYIKGQTSSTVYFSTLAACEVSFPPDPDFTLLQ